jgi:hypothetical protein
MSCNANCGVAAVVLFDASETTMPDDSLPLPDIFAAPANQAEYEAFYAELVRGDPSPVAEELGRSLADFAAAVAQIETVLQPSGTSAPEVHFAVERIQDIARALRQRDVEAPLCDALDAAIREVGDALVRNDAAAALLRELARRVNDMIARTTSAAMPAAAMPAAEMLKRSEDLATRRSGDAERFDDTVPGSAADTVEEQPSAGADAATLLRSVPVLPLADRQARAAPKENRKAPVEMPLPSPFDNNEAARLRDGKDEAAQEAFASESLPSISAASDALKGPPAETPLAGPHADTTAATNANPGEILNDPLAPLRALSEEELIALFS